MSRKQLMVIVAAVMLCTTVVPGAFAAGAQEGSVQEEPVTITWLAKYDEGEDRSWSLEYFNEQLNVNIVPYGVDTNDREQVRVMLASGEYPDCGFVHVADPKPLELYDGGLIRSIPREMIRKHAPAYTRRLDQDHPSGWLVELAPDKKDEHLGILAIQANIDVPNEAAALRVDWTRIVGKELPNYESKKVQLDRFGRVHYWEEPVRLEWLEDVLLEIRHSDPDANGKVDTIPWGGNSSLLLTWAPIMGAFGVAEGYNLMSGEKLYEWNVSPNFRDFLKLAARWYELGLVDQELLELNTKKAWAKISSGQVAAGTGRHVWTGRARFESRPPNAFATPEEAAAGAEVAVFLPVGPEGEQGSHCGRPAGPFNGTFTVNSKVDDKKLAKILQVIDFMRYDTQESWVYAQFGKPGAHFDWEGEPWNSNPLPREAKNVPDEYPTQGIFPTYKPPNYSRDRFKFLLPSDLASFWETFQYGLQGQGLAIRPYRYDLVGATKYAEVNIEYGKALKDIAMDFYRNAVTGEIDIDAEWDAYVEHWYSSGGRLLTAELEKAPLLEEFLKGRIVQ